MAALDGCLERLLHTLDRTGAAEDTIVVFTSDHGDMMLSQGLTTKLYPWDESIRVPLLVRYPRKLGRTGRRIRTPINSPDLMPTLLGLCGLAIPDSVEGADFSGILTGASKAPPDSSAFLNLPVPITEARRYGIRGISRTCERRATRMCGRFMVPGCSTITSAILSRCTTCATGASTRQLRLQLDRTLDATLRRRNDEFLPAAEYVKRAGLGHYREVNVPVGRHPSPWGDWDSTLTAP